MATWYVDPQGVARRNLAGTTNHASGTPNAGRKARTQTGNGGSGARAIMFLLLWLSPLLLLAPFLRKSPDDPTVYAYSGGRLIVDEEATAREKLLRELETAQQYFEAQKPPQYQTVEEWMQAIEQSRMELNEIRADAHAVTWEYGIPQGVD